MKARFLTYICIIIYGIFATCAGFSMPSHEKTDTASSPARTLLRTIPEVRPEWAGGNIPKNETEIPFVGVSNPFATDAESRDAARNNAFIQVLQYYGMLIRSSAIEKSSLSGKADEVLAPYLQNESEITRFAENLVSQILPEGYYTEVWMRADNTEEYITSALCTVPKQKAETDIATFEKRTSERYANLLAIQDTLYTTLLMYSSVIDTLSENPLHRAVAYYDSPNGRVSLYEYCVLQLNVLANSVSFDVLPSFTVQKNEPLNVTVALRSSALQKIGHIDCQVELYGVHDMTPKERYTVTADNSFLLQVFTQRLEARKYEVRLELLLQDISAHIQKNPTIRFSFDVTPLNWTFSVNVLGDTADGRVKRAVQKAFEQNELSITPDNGEYTVNVSINAPITEGPYGKDIAYSIRGGIEIVITSNGKSVFPSYSETYGECKHLTQSGVYNLFYKNVESDIEKKFRTHVAAMLGS
jgi:hypothetical protein